MNEILMPVSRQTFVGNIAAARQMQFTQLPPWAQSGTMLGAWPYPQFNENLAVLFDLGRIGLTQTILPATMETLTTAYDTLRQWLTGRGVVSEDDFADAIEQWAAENWAGPVWGEG